MARYPSSIYSRRLWLRKWIYAGSSLLVLVLIVVIVLVLRHSSEPEQEGLTTNSNVQAPHPVAPEPIVEAEPIADTQPQRPADPEPEVSEQPPPPPVTESYARAAELIDEAMKLLKANPARVIKARDTLNDVLKLPMSPQQSKLVKDQLSRLAERWLLSKRLFTLDPLCPSYQVQRGDRLLEIANRHKVPWEVLQQINQLSRPEALQAGQVIKIVNGPFHAKVNRSTFTMEIYLQQTFVTSFDVGLGREGKDTPAGLWLVKPGGKLKSPPWTDPDTGNVYRAGDMDYPLGSRWIALEGVGGNAVGRTGFGIHGTKDPETIGTATSRGCIRLHNGDAIKVYNLLTPGLSQVIVE